MKYLFWNTNKVKGINSYISALIETYQPNIVALAEYDDDMMSELILQLRKKGLKYYVVKRVASRIWILTTFPKKYVKHGADATHYTIKIFPYSDSKNVSKLIQRLRSIYCIILYHVRCLYIKRTNDCW